jgi:magnesium-transporting ATPase (P-type)
MSIAVLSLSVIPGGQFLLAALRLNGISSKLSAPAITPLDIVKIIIVASLTLASMLIAVVGFLLNLYSTLKMRPSEELVLESLRKLIRWVYWIIFLGGVTGFLSLIYFLFYTVGSSTFLDAAEMLFYVIVVLFGLLIIMMLASVRKVVSGVFKEVR